jgi:hypothetical protein
MDPVDIKLIDDFGITMLNKAPVREAQVYLIRHGLSECNKALMLLQQKNPSTEELMKLRGDRSLIDS